MKKKRFTKEEMRLAHASRAYLYQWSDRKTYFNKQNAAWEDYTGYFTNRRSLRKSKPHYRIHKNPALKPNCKPD